MSGTRILPLGLLALSCVFVGPASSTNLAASDAHVAPTPAITAASEADYASPPASMSAADAAAAPASTAAADAAPSPASTAASDADDAPPPASVEERLSRLEEEVLRGRQQRALDRGARIYARACATCHGSAGRGDGPAAADLDPAPRDLVGGQIRFRSTASGAAPRPEDLERTIKRGLPGTSMPAFGDVFSRGERDDLIRFLYALVPGQALREADMPAPVAVRPVGPPGPGSIVEGRGLFLLLECWTCHGVDGSGRSAAAMFTETGKPIRPPDLRFAPLKRGRDPEGIVRTLRTGLNGTPMPSYDEAMVFVREDVSDLSLLAGRLPENAIGELEVFVRTVPSRADVASMDESGLVELRNSRLEALAHYLLSLDRRERFWNWLLREEPEREVRFP